MLTARQSVVLKCIREYSKRGYSPRQEEIMIAAGLRTTSSVRLHLKTLERLGYLRPRPKGVHRAIILADHVKAAA
jgi:repressor LexA